jgi:hypothetical protein
LKHVNNELVTERIINCIRKNSFKDGRACDTIHFTHVLKNTQTFGSNGTYRKK